MLFVKAVIQVILALLFFGCLFQFSYGYYQYVRLMAFVLFGVLAFNELRVGHYLPGILCIGAFLLVNPIFIIYPEREAGRGVDKIIASLLLLWIMLDVTLFLTPKAKFTDDGGPANNTTGEVRKDEKIQT